MRNILQNIGKNSGERAADEIARLREQMQGRLQELADSIDITVVGIKGRINQLEKVGGTGKAAEKAQLVSILENEKKWKKCVSHF